MHGRIIDEKGKRYGHVVVLEITDKRDKCNGSVIWKCKCDCGRIFYPRGSNLRNGNTRSCGRCNKRGD